MKQHSHPAPSLEAALLHHRAGRLEEADAIYRKMPNNASALHFRGLLAHQQHRHEDAIALLGNAIALQPANAEYYYTLDTVCRAANRLDNIIDSYQKLLEHQPDNPIAWNRLGNAIKDNGMPADAATCYQNALSIKPDFAEAYNNLGILLADNGELEGAIECYQQALAIAPSDASTYANLGIALRKLGKLDEAIAASRKALELHPDFAAACSNLGNALLDQDKREEALAQLLHAAALEPGNAMIQVNLGNGYLALENIVEARACFERAIALKPDLPEAHAGLGACLAFQEKLLDAMTCILRATELRPGWAEAFNQLGLLFTNDHAGQLKQLGERAEQAIICYRQALAFKPELATAHNNLGLELQAQGKTEEAIASYRKAITHEPDYAEAHSNLLLSLLYSSDHAAEELFEESQRYATRFETPHKPFWPAHGNTRDPDKRLKLGYVSGDFRKHSVAFFIEPVLANHDRSHFEIFCYHNYSHGDEVTQRLQTLTDHWIPCHAMSDDALAARIQQDGIDILIDLSGHSALNRLPVFARKPAPIQMTWIGVPATTGLSAMDYRITDAMMDPPGMTEQFHSETLLRLPYSAPFQPSKSRPPVNALPALGSGIVTFACLNNLAKISQECFSLWAEILHALPHARLMLGNASTAAVRQELVDTFARHGIQEQQLVIQPRKSLDEFLALHHQIDIALDAFPYNGGTTSLHALTMGVPILTMEGETSQSRAGAIIMNSMGLPQFVTATKEDYVRRAIEIASDLPALAEIRHRIGAAYEAYDQANGDDGFTRQSFEPMLRLAWSNWCQSRQNHASVAAT
jgi:predicted O-linked N-acetylglucosamine transferase (SPINDLY family)